MYINANSLGDVGPGPGPGPASSWDCYENVKFVCVVMGIKSPTP